MMKDDSPIPEVPEDGMDLSTPAQADWPLNQVKDIVWKLYKNAPFDVKNTERWKALVRQAFDFFDNLDRTCEEILKERRVMRAMKAEAQARGAVAEHLPNIVPFKQAAQFVTGEKRTDRAVPKFDKILRYSARWKHWLLHPPVDPAGKDMIKAGMLPKLPGEKSRQVEAQIEMWRQNGIPKFEMMMRRMLFRAEWARVKAEENAKKARKKPKWSTARRLKAQGKAKWG
jgi:hypothetical protein